MQSARSSESESSSHPILALQPVIALAARKLIGPARYFADPRDLEQDAFVRCLAAHDRYDGSFSVQTFHAKRIWGAMVDGLRRWEPRRRKQRIRKESLSETANEKRVSPDPSPADLVLFADLRTAVATLPRRQAEVVRRYYFEGETDPEISRAMGLSKSRIFQLRCAAISSLRQYFR